jgi:hypothetical protein
MVAKGSRGRLRAPMVAATQVRRRASDAESKRPERTRSTGSNACFHRSIKRTASSGSPLGCATGRRWRRPRRRRACLLDAGRRCRLDLADGYSWGVAAGLLGRGGKVREGGVSHVVGIQVKSDRVVMFQALHKVLGGECEPT